MRPALAALLSAGLLVPAAVPAAAAPAEQAAAGRVVVFSTEFQPLTTFEDPAGCKALPLGAHVVSNQTDGPITIYYDPLCVLPIEPFAEVKPGFGTHVSSVGSFRA